MKWVWRILGALAALLVIAFLIFRVPDTDPEEMRAKYGGAPSRFIEIGDGVTVHLRDEGPRDGVPIILLHGSAADLHTWQPWVEGLSDTYRLIRFDQVGHGLTGPDTSGDYSIENFVADIDEVADALGLESFVLGGNSMGGGHTVAYALEHPERLRGMILVDAGGAPVRGESKGNIGFTIARTPVLNQIMKHITPRGMIERSLSQSVSNQDVVTDATVTRYWEMLRYPGNRAATIARFSGNWRSFSEQEVASITVPALVMWGEEDALIALESGRWYAETLPSSTLVTYAGIGHLPQEEAPDRSIADVRNWLETLQQD
ncbi:MAG: alpha/beta fold hydrolase [Erythrobacter sp.]